MVYPDNFDEKTGFDRVRQMLAGNCIAAPGKKIVAETGFLTDLNEINRLLSQTQEMLGIMIHGAGFQLSEYSDLSEELIRVKTEGTYLDQENLASLRSMLAMARDCGSFLQSDTAKYPELMQLWFKVELDFSLIQKTDEILDQKGRIRDNASNGLKKIRKDLSSLQKSVENRIQHHLRMARKEGWVSQDTEIAVRYGRMVIPVPAAHKRQIRGFIHDESATGQTVYIEPEEVFETNNNIRELENAERREIVRILKDFTSGHIRPFINEIKSAARFIATLDFIRAKALFAREIGAKWPKMTGSPLIAWKNALHPLLYLSHRKQGKKVVAQNIELNKNQRILVISGPNAGGKSVCLKTAALLQYMLQCGLLIPVSEGSEAGVFDQIFIDIGDEQSLENDLSTYSSHLLNMKHFVRHANPRTFFLVDEFGTGTDPQLGGPIAEAVLEELNNKGAFGMVTTHYSNLKLLARAGNGIVNGAMLFDTDKMEPLFVLKTGKPGSSFAFEIARKTGFPEEILLRAAEKTGRKQLDFDEQLQQLEVEKNELQKKLEEFTVADDFLGEMIEKYKKLTGDLERRRDKIIEEAQNEALRLVGDSNRLIENTIREIRQEQAQKEKTKALRQKLEEHGQKLEKQKEKRERQKQLKTKAVVKEPGPIEPAPPEPIAAGDFVVIPDQETAGQVVKIKEEDIWIAFGSVILKTTLGKCTRVPADAAKKKTTMSGTSFSGILADRLASFGFSIDVRGKRGDEATEEVKKYIESAMILKMPEVRIIHGKGYGILRTLVHDYLKTVPEVSEFGDEHVERGGHGVTVVRLEKKAAGNPE
ncbi:MAG: Smr/MutS family protein [Bacteroidales bacterium]|nr:Smr/MutS family protein [Bacteroidales bacterium]